MPSSLAEMSYATALNRNELFATPELRTIIPTKVLAPDEEVILVLPGVASDFPLVLVVTRQRTLLVKVGGMIRRARIRRELAPGDVRGATFGGGAFHRLHVQVRSGRDLSLLPHRTADASRFCDALNHLVATGGLPAGM